MFPHSEVLQAQALDKLHILRSQAQAQRMLHQAPRPGRLKLAALLRKLAQRLEGKPLSPTKPI